MKKGLVLHKNSLVRFSIVRMYWHYIIEGAKTIEQNIKNDKHYIKFRCSYHSSKDYALVGLEELSETKI